jgi:DNA-binding response OmpR family regulator
MAEHQHALLVVEDDLMIRDLIVDVLTTEGFRVDTVEECAAAVARLEREVIGYCAVLLDVMLPYGSGVDLIAYTHERAPSTVVIAMSASPQHLARAMHAGADVSLPKPFDLADLIDVINRHCPTSTTV